MFCTPSTAGTAARKKSFSMERTIPIETGKETMIEIDKEGKGLGLSIVGGSDTVLGTVVIHEIYPDGAAAKDGRLQPGDQVLEVNGTSLRGVPHDTAIAALRRTPPKVRLLIYRDVNLQMSLLDPAQIYNIFEIELHKKPGRGLGLSIVGRKNEPGVYVSEIVKGGAAEADGRLATGDQILAVNGQNVANSMQEDVAAMLKTCIGKVCLKVGRWKIAETTTRVQAAREALEKASATTPRTDDASKPAASTSSATASASASASAAGGDTTNHRSGIQMPHRPLITHTSPSGETTTGGTGRTGADSTTSPQDGLSPVQEEPSTMSVDDKSQQHKVSVTQTAPSPAIKKDSKQAMSHHPPSEKMSTASQQGLIVEILHDLKEEGSETLLVELKKASRFIISE
ncbi:hypothetical protein WR25_14179 [Diploscapter pachys]|uniref:PDZ domain-containing protein n=1 Tax=Diploscapter pachys TaxID=2018661 RepID=A0A2A2KUI8_9BILA|nr:hypothetical protein WR25_14179 [Diploscapter pachys]